MNEKAEPRLRSPAPSTPQEALARAREHGRASAAEALAALQALLEAAALSTTGKSSDVHVVLGPAARLLGGLAEELAPGRGGRASASLVASVTQALDAEIARWEQRARDDADARAVLRAFLGLREVLWEFGIRPGRPPEEKPAHEGSHPVRTRRSRHPRVQRIAVEG